MRLSSSPTQSAPAERNPYTFILNDPYDRSAPLQLVVPALIESRAYMRSIREFGVPADSVAIWYLGQNGFIIGVSTGLRIG